MKNIGKILLLGFMTISMVAGCDLSDLKNLIKDSSDSSQNDNSDSSSDDANGYEGDKGDSSSSNGGGNAGSDSSTNGGGNNNNNQAWSEAAANLMKEHLYGVVLPYTGSSASVVDYDAEYDMITITGGDVTLAGYQAALIADDYGLVGEDEETGAFAVEKAVTTSEGQRFVYVYAEMDEEDGFSAQAFDPYYYSWPTNQIAAFFEDYEAEPYEIPSVDAEGAYFAFQESDYNFVCILIGYLEYVSATVVSYNCSANDFETYLDKLEAASWTLEWDEEYEAYAAEKTFVGQGDASMDVYYSADYEAIVVNFYAYMSLSDIDPDVIYEEWPAGLISSLLGYGLTDKLPEYTGANNGFSLLDDSYGTAILVYVTEGTETAGVAAYLDILDDAGYEENGTDKFGDTIYTSPNNEINVTVYYATSGTFTITFAAVEEEKETGEWPTSKVASALSALVPEAKDTIPALDGADSYNVFEEYDSFQIQAVYSTASEANSAKSAYATTLKTAGFTEGGEDKYGDMNYNSPNKEFYINMWYSSSNGYKVILDVYAGEFVPQEASTEWPSDDVSAFMTANSYTDPLPVFEGGNDYMVDDGGDELYIIIDVDDPEQAQEDYVDALEEALFIFDSYDTSDDSPYYYSPNEQYIVNPYISSGGYFVILIF